MWSFSPDIMIDIVAPSVGQAEEVALPDVGVQEVSTFSISSH
jgi:hypothetical protein